ncbi:polyprotein of EF-Ts, chloroplastic isoform X2 [Cryptomeria japonica]|uniref:polyprotein of EF-Ts, chloroplastic isoform X2 n=1 Tax=Cryptomeria japonica TaxID=3369 RepID=UPI0027DA1EEA|nr:polyprotein of EF-Ts, chloroplastic isoform X2 [Cryptomeria japonica]
MLSAILCPIGTIQYMPGRTVNTRTRKHSKSSVSPQNSIVSAISNKTLPLRSFSNNFTFYQRERYSNIGHGSILHRLSASIGKEVTLEEPNIDIDQDAGQSGGVDNPSEGDKSYESGSSSETESVAAKDSSSSGQSKLTRNISRNENPRVPNEELVPGATFTGIIRRIQPFGAFVDFGASMDGLVHISRLSDSFVRDINDAVSVGQEVTVRIVDVKLETGRIALSMKSSDDSNRPSQVQSSALNSGEGGVRPVQIGKGAGRFSNEKREVTQKRSKLKQGQIVEGNVKNIVNSGAFISLPDGEEGFLRSNEASQNLSGKMELQIGQNVSVRVLRIEKGKVNLTMQNEEEEESFKIVLNKGSIGAASNPFELFFRKDPVISSLLEEKEKLQENGRLVESQAEVAAENLEEQEEEKVGTVGSGEEAALTEEVDDKISVEDITQIPESIRKDKGSEMLETNESLTNEKTEQVEDFSVLSTEKVVSTEYLTKEVSDIQDNEVNAMKYISDDKKDVEPIADLENSGPTSEASPNDVSSNYERTAISDSSHAVSDAYSSGKIINVPGDESPLLVTKTDTMAPTNSRVISAALVKRLREETGAGMMDCKKALTETGGDLEKASEFLRKKGLASAEKKATRIAAEGRIGSYIHDSRIGVLIEVNCETDFVARGEIFKELVEDMAMQIAASPNVQYVSVEDVSEDIVNKEREIELQKEDLLNKPAEIREKIVDGRIGKILKELTLLEQPYIKNDKIIVKDWIRQSIATLGENIRVRRFVQYNLGEGLEKKSQDFAAEIAAQTAANVSPSMLTEKPGTGAESSTIVEEIKPPVEKRTLISAALVKQLREETGAGMMDCKKALTETGGDLEKAQEFLRKKGLASADKKSGRIAAEGRVGSYIHDSRIGVLIEVNCETDFVARGDIFKQLVEDLAMQVVAYPQVQHVSVEDIPKKIVDKEREIEMQREDLLTKPENIREKIVEGRITKRLAEIALLEQPFIKDDSIRVKDFVKQAVASLGENIRVRRFIRYNLGEGIEKETKDLATEIAKQTTLKI